VISSMIHESSSSSFLNRLLRTLHPDPLTDSKFLIAHSNIFHISFNSDLITARL
jgi:hypothetical protein